MLDTHPHALPAGTRILDYTIESVIGTGGFSIVYRAMDTVLGRPVAIKEYFPASFAQRAQDGTVHPMSRERETFGTGITSFSNEGKMLAQFDHPALVRVYRCWEERGTAYLAMRLYDGVTLKDAVKDGRWSADEASLHALLAPLCETLDLLHAARCYHRDVAPDNILLTAGQMPVLLDFGAARRAIEGKEVFTAVLKPGYAPIEQYGDGELKQGPWTDIYGLCAVMHFALTGEPPPTAISRMLNDRMPSPRERFAGRLPERWLDAMAAGLAVQPEARPQSIAEFIDRLGWNETPAPLPMDAVDAADAPIAAEAPAASAAAVTPVAPSPPSTVVSLGSASTPAPTSAAQPASIAARPASTPPAPAAAPRRHRLWPAVAAVSLLLIAAAVWQMWRTPSATAAASSTEAAPATPVAAPPPAAPEPTPPAASQPAAPEAAAAAPLTVPAAATPSAADGAPTTAKASPALPPPAATAGKPAVAEPVAAKAKESKEGKDGKEASKSATARGASKGDAKPAPSAPLPEVPTVDEAQAATPSRRAGDEDDFASDRAAARRPVRCGVLLEMQRLGNPLSEDEARFVRERCH